MLQFPEETKLPIVFPALLYAGNKKPYPFTLDILDLFYDRSLAEKILAKAAHLIDVTQISDQEIKQHNIIGLLDLQLNILKIMIYH